MQSRSQLLLTGGECIPDNQSQRKLLSVSSHTSEPSLAETAAHRPRQPAPYAKFGRSCLYHLLAVFPETSLCNSTLRSTRVPFAVCAILNLYMNP